MKRWILAAVLIGLAACTQTVGHRFDPAVANDFRPGVTTLAQVKARLGPPTGVVINAHGDELATWECVHSSMTAARADVLRIVFGPDGKMRRIAGESHVD